MTDRNPSPVATMGWGTGANRVNPDRMEFGGEIMKSVLDVDPRPPVGSMKEKLALAVIRRIVKKIRIYQPESEHATEDDHVQFIWDTDEGLLRGRAIADVEAMLTELETVDHAFLDATREGLPMESGLAAKFWLRAIEVLKGNV